MNGPSFRRSRRHGDPAPISPVFRPTPCLSHIRLTVMAVQQPPRPLGVGRSPRFIICAHRIKPSPFRRYSRRYGSTSASCSAILAAILSRANPRATSRDLSRPFARPSAPDFIRSISCAYSASTCFRVFMGSTLTNLWPIGLLYAANPTTRCRAARRRSETSSCSSTRWHHYMLWSGRFALD